MPQLAQNVRLENAKKLYLEGIRDGSPREAIAKYTGSRYTQHSTGVKDGPEGFIEFFEEFIVRNPQRDIQIVRGFEDGQYVFLHVAQSLNGGASKWVTMDIFDTDADGKIIEHWDVISEFQDSIPSGRTRIDGPTEITDLDKTEANKALVRMFIVDVLQNGNYENVPNYVSAEKYHQHNGEFPDGMEHIINFFRGVEEAGEKVVYDFMFKVIGCGNFVAAYCKIIFNDEAVAGIDLFRLEDGRIVEHWDSSEEIAPREEWVNCGKF